MPSSTSVVSDLGMDWDEGISIPVANVENKYLEDEIQRKQQEIVSLRNQLSDHDDRVHAMSEHLKNVRQELAHTEGLENARKNEIESEEHMRKIAEREEGRLKQEILKLDKNLEELKEKRNIHENTIFKQSQQLEEMKSQMNWDQQALEAWLEESARKDEDAMILAKYTRMDDGKVKELSLKIESLTEEASRKRRQLDNETTETLTAQIELDKTAEEFRKAHEDRRQLIDQWEHTIEQMQRRDNEMDMLAVHLSKMKEEVRQREEQIKEKQQFLDNETDNNTEMEKKIQMAERTSGRTRDEYREAERQRDQFQNELEALKRTVDRTAIDLENTRGQVASLKKEVADKQVKYEKAKQLNEALYEKFQVVVESELSAEERAARMDELLGDEQTLQNEIDIELKRLRELQFRKTKELHEATRDEKDTNAEIQGGRAAIRNLNSKISKLDHDSLKQQEIVYNQDFTIQQLERRISRMAGEQSNDEKMHLESRIKQLNEELEARHQTRNLLTLQRKRLQDDVRRVKRDLHRTKAAKDELTSKIEELHLHNDSSERQLKIQINDKQNLMVEENLLKLQLHKLRQQLNSKADEVLTLEKRRLQLDTAMKERRHEINLHREMLIAQLKQAELERQQITSELHQRFNKIDMLQKRYEIQMVSMAPPGGEEEKSQAFYVIKAAQDKEQLQRQGDDLDEKIKKAEREIRALENTLRLLNSRNETYRKSFNKVTDTSEEMDTKEQLEEQYRAVMDKYKYKRRQIRELQEDLQTMSHTLERLSRDEAAYQELVEERQSRIKALQAEISEQEAKLQRATNTNARLQREVRTAAKAKDEMPEERDFTVRELRDMNKNAMKTMGEVIQQFPETTQSIHLYFTQANLPPPPTPGPGSRGSSRPTSARSSVSSSSGSRSSRGSVRAPASSSGSKQQVNMGAADFGLAGSPAGSARSSASSTGSGRSGRR